MDLEGLTMSSQFRQRINLKFHTNLLVVGTTISNRQ